jgi:hypothetical protein
MPFYLPYNVHISHNIQRPAPWGIFIYLLSIRITAASQDVPADTTGLSAWDISVPPAADAVSPSGEWHSGLDIKCVNISLYQATAQLLTI